MAGTSFSNSKRIPPQTTKARTTNFAVSTLQTAQLCEGRAKDYFFNYGNGIIKAAKGFD